uniref:Uncharacterized protein n=1 Tax=Glossina palpalis gambiensis TaxID=67801 RepID=A0A1B0BUQ7_9MUSC
MLNQHSAHIGDLRGGAKDVWSTSRVYQTNYTPRRTLTVDDTGSRANSARGKTQRLMFSSSAMDRVRKWSHKYDGDTNQLKFVERIEELCELYDMPLTIILIELFTGQALMWYRNDRRYWAG